MEIDRQISEEAKTLSKKRLGFKAALPLVLALLASCSSVSNAERQQQLNNYIDNNIPTPRLTISDAESFCRNSPHPTNRFLVDGTKYWFNGITDDCVFSPDGTKLAFRSYGTTWAYYLVDARTGDTHRLVAGEGGDSMYSAEWSPEGDKLLTRDSFHVKVTKIVDSSTIDFGYYYPSDASWLNEQTVKVQLYSSDRQILLKA